MNFDKESKSRIFFFFFFFLREGGGGGGEVGSGKRGMNMKAAMFFIHDKLSRPLLQNRTVP